MLPSPVMDWCTKEKLSVTCSPPGPAGSEHSEPGPFLPHEPCIAGQHTEADDQQRRDEQGE